MVKYRKNTKSNKSRKIKGGLYTTSSELRRQLKELEDKAKTNQMKEEEIINERNRIVDFANVLKENGHENILEKTGNFKNPFSTRSGEPKYNIIQLLLLLKIYFCCLFVKRGTKKTSNKYCNNLHVDHL